MHVYFNTLTDLYEKGIHELVYLESINGGRGGGGDEGKDRGRSKGSGRGENNGRAPLPAPPFSHPLLQLSQFLDLYLCVTLCHQYRCHASLSVLPCSETTSNNMRKRGKPNPDQK